MKAWLAILLLVLLTSCLREEDLVAEYKSFSPRDNGDGWQTGSPSENLVDSHSLDAIYRQLHDDDKSWPLRSLLVFRNGRIIGESYLKDEGDRYEKRAIWSCTKQVLALTAGILVGNSELFMTDRLEQFLGKYLSSHRDKEDLTIGQVFTMRSGIGFHNDEHSDVFRKRKTSNSIDFVLGLAYENSPGSVFNYNDGDPQILSAVITSITSRPADQFAKDELFSRIGFTKWEWRRYDDGLTLGAFGILTTPRELSKIGQLVLDSGMHDSLQVVSKEWIREMLSVQCSVPKRPGLDFGYYWWLDKKRGYSFMWGHGGQYLILLHAKNAMVVITSIEQLDDDFMYSVEDALQLADKIGATMH